MAHPRRPHLIAHRGFASRYPENTLCALRAALEAGAAYVEFDVQLSADCVPVVIHDATLKRTAGIDGSVLEMPLARLREVDVGEPERFGSRFRGERIAALADTVALLSAWPHATAFVELKRASIRRFGAATFHGPVLEALEPMRRRSVVISYDHAALVEGARRGAAAVGWVLERLDGPSRSAAEALRPGYLFAEKALLPPQPQPLWPGPWQWAVYDVDDPQEALSLAARGVAFVESRAVGDLLADPRLRPPTPTPTTRAAAPRRPADG